MTTLRTPARGTAWSLTATVVALAVVACSGGDHAVDPTAAPTSDPSPTSTPPSPTPSPPEVTTSAPPVDPPSVVVPQPDDDVLESVTKQVSDLSDAELAGQLVVASYGGTDSSGAAALVSELGLGGVIVLGENVPEQWSDRVPAMSDLTGQVHDAVRADRDWPAFIGVDQEGGPLTRIGTPLDRWPSAMAIGASGDLELASQVAAASGEQLLALGFTVVYAPVADVTSGPDDPTIALRSPGADEELVAAVAVAQMSGYIEAGILPVVKHFPGHGSVPADTHLGLVEQPADLEELWSGDLVPFETLAAAGAPAVMMSHIVVTELDSEMPASLSPAVTTGLLRDDLGFGGLIVTDALNMRAISDRYGSGTAAVLALEAGADVVLMPPDPYAAVDAITTAIGDGTLQREDLEDSAAMMVTAMLALEAPRPAPSVVGSQTELAQQAALAGITQLDGACGEDLVGDSIRVVGGSDSDQRQLREAAESAGLSTGSGTTVLLLTGPSEPASADVVVALDTPYALEQSNATTARIATYGRGPATMQALVEVLTGEVAATGRLPVPVGELPIGTGCS